MPELRAYQRAGIQFLRQGPPNKILNDYMGMGKTCVVVSDFDGTSKPNTRILIVAPDTTFANWTREILTWTDATPDQIACVSKPQHVNRITTKTKWLITTWDAIRVKTTKTERGKTTKIAIQIGYAIFGWKPNFIAFDEAHRKLKNVGTQYHTGVKMLTSLATRVTFMTGTLLANHVLNLWVLLNLCDRRKWSSKWAFLKDHANAHPGAFGWQWTRGATDPKRLAAEVKDYVLCRRPEDVGLELPDVFFNDIYFPMSDQQALLTKEVVETGLLETPDELMFVTNGLAKMTRLRQIALSPAILGIGGYGSKIDYVVETVVHNPDQKFVVFCEWSVPLNFLQNALEAESIRVAVLMGPTSDVDAPVTQFQTDDETRVFLTTIAKGGPGISLTRGDVVIFLNKSYAADDNEQAWKRVHRDGRVGKVLVQNLRTENSIEDEVYDTLLEKATNAEAVLTILRSYAKDFMKQYESTTRS
jgi:SNF2 family DNA or RNA helicase